MSEASLLELAANAFAASRVANVTLQVTAVLPDAMIVMLTSEVSTPALEAIWDTNDVWNPEEKLASPKLA